MALPSMSSLVANYVPKEAKSRALGMCYSGFHLGGCCCCGVALGG